MLHGGAIQKLFLAMIKICCVRLTLRNIQAEAGEFVSDKKICTTFLSTRIAFSIMKKALDALPVKYIAT